jgi:uncharacterized membrane protein YfcA
MGNPFTRSQIQSFLAVVVASAASIGGTLGAVNPKLATFVALTAALSAAVGRTLSAATDNQAITYLGVVVAILSVLGGVTDIIPPAYTAYLGIAATALAAAGRSIWGNKFPEIKPDGDNGNQ